MIDIVGYNNQKQQNLSYPKYKSKCLCSATHSKKTCDNLSLNQFLSYHKHKNSYFLIFQSTVVNKKKHSVSVHCHRNLSSLNTKNVEQKLTLWGIITKTPKPIFS